MTALQDLIARCLSDRFQSAREIADAATRKGGRAVTISAARQVLKALSARGQCETTESVERRSSVATYSVWRPNLRPVRMYRRAAP